ncbi:hypothetical protein C2G38_2045318 [Gigaspora rosea]|uniref:Uncharacterized protein n=1 Tax=Gigaspora rosea TaxID=44941 RepID=A0A397UD44_9GLOM|nr:hypothetical protein C2G38_2045318 [Gigaspora rosea]
MHNEGQSFFCTREEKYGAVVYWEVSDPTRNLIWPQGSTTIATQANPLDQNIFMDEREAFEEALNQNIQKQNGDLIDLTDNTNMKGLYYSPFLEPNERPIKRARSASPRLGRSATPTSPTIKITINN